MCGTTVAIDKSAGTIVFAGKSQTVSSSILSDGWQTFNIAKPNSAKKTGNAANSSNGIPVNLPATHERLKLGLGLGYVQNADFGLNITASGKLDGGDLGFSAIVTQGEQGTKLRSSHLIWVDRHSGKSIEAGDMYSEAWGLVQGARLSWRASKNRWPAITLNLNTKRTDNPQTSISYSDEFKLAHNVTVRGEVGMDRSGFVSTRIEGRPLQVFAFRRTLPDDLGNSKGIFGSLSLSKSVSLFYGVTSTEDSMNRHSTFRNTGLRMPIFKRCNLLIGETSSESDTSRTTTRSAGITIPIARSMHLFLQYQNCSWDTTTMAGYLLNMQGSTNSMLTSLSVFANPRVHLDYQMNSQFQEGRTTSHEQLVTNYTLSNRSSLQVISGFPNMTDMNTLRVRLNHRLADNTAIVVDYGRLCPYQTSKDLFGKRGLTIMLRKTWPLSVPAKGGTVSGQVVDKLGQPIRGVAVRLGSYTAISGKDGEYEFTCVPPNTYSIRIAEESVPADHRVETKVQSIVVGMTTSHQVDFRLVPFGSITGVVFVDENDNDEYDANEGISDVAVRLKDKITATNKSGRFSFYNLDPGPYKVELAAEYLNSIYVVQGESETNVELQPKEIVSGMQFKLQLRQKPIVFTTLD